MAYTLTNLEDDIRNYTEVSSTVLTSAILNPIIKNKEWQLLSNGSCQFVLEKVCYE